MIFVHMHYNIIVCYIFVSDMVLKYFSYIDMIFVC